MLSVEKSDYCIMSLNRIRQTFVCLSFVTFFSWASPALSLEVTVSIAPVHSLVSALTEGVSEPALIVSPNASPHQFELRPSDAKALAKADLVIWVGPSLEYYLEKPIDTLSSPEKVVTLMELEQIAWRPFDAPCQHHHHGESADHKHDHDHDHDHDHGDLDPHFWLDPIVTAQAMHIIKDKLIELDPEHESIYLANANKLEQRLHALQQSFDEDLTDVRDTAFMVYHDAYGYFTDRFDLNLIGAFNINPNAPLSLRRIKDIRKQVDKHNVVALFREPGVNIDLMNRLAEQTGTRLGTLDPIGYDIEPGPDAYFEMMQRLNDELKSTLQDLE